MSKTQNNKKYTKRECMKKHFEKRCFQRTGEHLKHKDLFHILHNGGMKFLYKQSNRLSVYYYEYKGIKYALVYDSIRKCFVTILYYDLLGEDYDVALAKELYAVAKEEEKSEENE